MGLLQNIHQETVSQLPLREALLVPPEESIRAAISIMKSKQLGCVIVVDGDGKPLGTFTERCVVDVLADNPEVLNTATVGEHLDPKWTCVLASEPVFAVVKAMKVENVRFVVVLDDAGKAIALTGQRGLMEYVAEHYPQQVMVQRVGSKPSADREGA